MCFVELKVFLKGHQTSGWNASSRRTFSETRGMWPSLKGLNRSNVFAWLKASSPKSSFSFRWVSAAVLLGLKQNPLLFDIRHFDNHRDTWKRCKGNSQISETPAFIKTPVGWLTVERYSKRHLAAQIPIANRLRYIIKFSKILGSPTYYEIKPEYSLYKRKDNVLFLYNKSWITGLLISP